MCLKSTEILRQLPDFLSKRCVICSDQVHARARGNGNVTISVAGPQPHSVTETSVIYTGDDLYEITYEVTRPGFYIIAVMWGHYHICDSPFVSDVTM